MGMLMLGGKEPGDFMLLRHLCKEYGLDEVLAKAELVAGRRDCGPGHCSDDCTMVCSECWYCVDECTLRR